MGAYRFIIEQARRVELELNGPSPGGLTEVSFISLDELMRLRQGLAEPSHELVVSPKRLLGSAATEAEIDAHLVTPFRDGP